MTDNRFPIAGVRRADAGPFQRAHRIKCGRCGETDHVAVTGRLKVIPDAALAKRFTQAGWTVGKTPDRDLCPTCSITKSKETLPMVKTEPLPMAKAVDAPALSPAPPQRSEDARKARLDVDLMLVDNFFPAIGRYKEGWSDERVAKESGLALDFVVKRREAEHGQLVREIDAQRLLKIIGEFETASKTTLDELSKRLDVARALASLCERDLTAARMSIEIHLGALRRLAAGK